MLLVPLGVCVYVCSFVLYFCGNCVICQDGSWCLFDHMVSLGRMGTSPSWMPFYGHNAHCLCIVHPCLLGSNNPPGWEVGWFTGVVGSFRRILSCPGSWLTLKGKGKHIDRLLSPALFLVLISKPQLLKLRSTMPVLKWEQ